ncbi:hypothetical protein GCM10009091_24860 [Pseudomonas brenneri]|nr:hypothetical protein GCM10009091_24860 [Pseudomonas brenneri]
MLARDSGLNSPTNLSSNPLFTPSLRPLHPLALVPLRHSCGQCPHTRQSPYDGETSMSVLDGVSLLLAVALFIYLLVALLRADRG